MISVRRSRVFSNMTHRFLETHIGHISITIGSNSLICKYDRKALKRSSIFKCLKRFTSIVLWKDSQTRLFSGLKKIACSVDSCVRPHLGHPSKSIIFLVSRPDLAGHEFVLALRRKILTLFGICKSCNIFHRFDVSAEVDGWSWSFGFIDTQCIKYRIPVFHRTSRGSLVWGFLGGVWI